MVLEALSDHIDEDRVGWFVEGGSVRWTRLAGSLVTSFVLMMWAGFTRLQEAIFRGYATLIEAPLAFLAELARVTISTPVDSWVFAWGEAVRAFPIAGPLDFALGVAVLAIFLIVANALISRMMEGI